MRFSTSTVILSILICFTASAGQSVVSDSLLVEIHIAISKYCGDILEYGDEIHTIAKALTKTSSFEWDIAMAVAEAAGDSYDYLSWASDFIVVYELIQDRNERNFVAGYLNARKADLVERLKLMIMKVDSNLAHSDNQHLIIQGNKLKEKIKEAKNELDSFQF